MKTFLPKLFTPCSPASFTERRQIILNNWQRYGYQRRPRMPLSPANSLSERINQLMFCQIIKPA